MPIFYKHSEYRNDVLYYEFKMGDWGIEPQYFGLRTHTSCFQILAMNYFDSKYGLSEPE